MSRRVARLLVLLALLAIAAGVLGCSASTSDLASQQKNTCFANQRRILLAINMVNADTGVYPDVKNAVKELNVSCPAGGTYSFDPKTDVVSCSVHGVAPKESGE